jgi:branched-chain amino acid transport system permease protein
MIFERRFLLGALAIATVFPLLGWSEYVIHVGVLIMFSIMLATGFNLIVGYVGEFSLGHTAFLGIGAYTAALLSSSLGMPIFFNIAAAAVVAAIAGFFIGAVTLRLRGPFFVIVTLCFAEVLRIVANNWVALTNGPMGIAGIVKPAWMAQQTALQQKIDFYYIGLALVTVCVYFAYRFVYSFLGRAVVTIRENRFVAQSVGIWPYSYSLLAFVVASAMAGVAGAFYAHYVSYVGPEVFGFPFMISMIIMVLLGGKGTLIGPVIGPVIVVLLEEYLRDFKDLRFSIFGLVIVAVVLFVPQGLMGFVAARREQYARK